MVERWKVLIADDEMIIREGIMDAVDWDSLQLEVVAEAEDGEEALELAVEHEVHILLADINMPIMNGITLIKNLRKKLPDCKIIIITGHDEFSYAQEAVRLNVTDYIMKPVNPEQLRTVLENISNELVMEASQKSHFELAAKQIEKNFPLLRERFCIDWIKGNMSEEEILNQLQFLRLPAEVPKMLGVVRWPEMQTNQPLMTEGDRQLNLFAIENIVEELIQDCKKVLFRDDSDLLVIVIWEEVGEEIRREMERSILNFLKVVTIQHFEKINGTFSDVENVYRACKSEVFNKTEVSQLVRRAEYHISQHFQDPDLSLETVANSLHVSSVYLSRMIKQDLGISFVNLLTKTRMKKAIQLLNSTNLTINEISEQVGYDTQHYFSTSFKKVMGVSPNQYRKGDAFQGKEI